MFTFRVEKSHNHAVPIIKPGRFEPGASGRTDETARKENPVDLALWKAAKPGEISGQSLGTWSSGLLLNV